MENLLQNINKLELFLKKKKKPSLELKPTLESNKPKETIKKIKTKGKENTNKKKTTKSTIIESDKPKSVEKKEKEKIEKKKLPVNKDGILRVNRTWADHKEFEMKKGVFTQAEKDLVQKTLIAYAYEHNLSEEALLDLITEKQKKGESSAWTTISECLPERSVQSIHNLCHRLFDPNNYKGEWSSEEEQTLIKLYEEYGPKWLKIAKVIERTPVNVKDKWKQLGGVNIKNRVDESWTFTNHLFLLFCIGDDTNRSLANYSVKFVKMDNVDEVLKIDQEESIMYIDKEMKKDSNKIRIYNLLKIYININELTKIVEEKIEISWTTISARMKSYSYVDCKNKFSEIINYFNIDKKCSLRKDIKMIKKLLKFNFDSLEEVDYSYVKNKRDADTNKKQLEDLIKCHDPYGIKNLNDTLQRILEDLNNQLNKNNDILNEEAQINKENLKVKRNENKFNIVNIYREYKKKRDKK